MPGLLETQVTQLGEDIAHGTREAGRHMTQFGRNLLGLPETAMTLGVGMAGMVPGGFAAAGLLGTDPEDRPMGYRDQYGVWHPSLMATADNGGVPMQPGDAVEYGMNKAIQGYQNLVGQPSPYAQGTMQALGQDINWLGDKLNRYVVDPSIQSGVGAGLAAPVIGTGMASLMGILETLPGGRAKTAGTIAGRAARAGDVPTPRPGAVGDLSDTANLLALAAGRDPALQGIIAGNMPLARAAQAARQRQGVNVLEGAEVELGGKTYRASNEGGHSALRDEGDALVLIDRDDFEHFWSTQRQAEEMTIGPGPEYRNQIGKRIENFREFWQNNDDITVGNFYYDPKSGLASGNGRHRTRVMLESGMPQIPVTMPKKDAALLQEAIDARRAAGERPGLLGQTAAGRGQRGSIDDEVIGEGSKELAKAQATRTGILEVIPERDLKAGEFNEMATGVRAREEFNQKLSEARQTMDPRNRLQVDEALPADFDGKTFITPDGMAGFAMSKDGYISNLFRNEGAGFRGTMEAALTKARAEGARNLDAFDTYLADGYIKRGAVETGRSPFNPEFAPPGWDPATMGTPDYVSMNIGGVIPTQKFPTLLDPRPQQALPRYVPPRGEPQAVIDAFKGGRVARLNRLVDEGLAQSGDQWYWMGGMLDKFIVELGPKLGVERFDKFMDLNAAVSPRSTVNQQIKRSSILYQRHLRGEDITDMHQPIGTAANPQGLEPAFLPGYGHLAHNIHMDAIRALEGGAPLSPLSQQKIASYAENLKGNYQPLTVDTHNYQILTGRNTSPTLAQYPFLESRQFALAQRRGLDPAEWQSALWVGGKDITGVRDARNFPDAMNQRIAKTAEVLEIPEAEAFVRFLNGDTQLYSVMAAMFLGPAAYQALLGSEETNGT